MGKGIFDLIILGLFIFIGFIGVVESISVGNFTFAALILGLFYLIKLMARLIVAVEGTGEAETPESREEG